MNTRLSFRGIFLFVLFAILVSCAPNATAVEKITDNSSTEKKKNQLKLQTRRNPPV